MPTARFAGIVYVVVFVCLLYLEQGHFRELESLLRLLENLKKTGRAGEGPMHGEDGELPVEEAQEHKRCAAWERQRGSAP